MGLNPQISYVRILLVVAIVAVPVAYDFTVRGLRRFPFDPVLYVPDGDAERGHAAILRYGCGACHTIPGVRVATGRVGPQLLGIREQLYIGGVLPNLPDNMVSWLQNPWEHNPRSAMPNLDITEQDARDIAAYLYSLP